MQGVGFSGHLGHHLIVLCGFGLLVLYFCVVSFSLFSVCVFAVFCLCVCRFLFVSLMVGSVYAEGGL